MAKIIAVIANKGGVLKTSIAVNLAGVLARDGKKVLIVDTDSQGDVAISFGEQPDELAFSVYDVLVEGYQPKRAIYNVYENIDIIPANDDMTGFEFEILPNQKKFKHIFDLFKNMIEKIKNEYDYILVDCPPHLGLVVGNVLSASDEVIIPFQPEVYSMRSFIKTLNTIKQFKTGQNPKLRIAGVVATLVDGRTALHSDVLQECRKYCQENDIPMLETFIPRTIRYASSIAYYNLPATLSEKNKELTKAYYELERELFNG